MRRSLSTCEKRRWDQCRGRPSENYKRRWAWWSQAQEHKRWGMPAVKAPRCSASAGQGMGAGTGTLALQLVITYSSHACVVGCGVRAESNLSGHRGGEIKEGI